MKRDPYESAGPPRSFQGLAPSPSLVGEASSIHPSSPAQGAAARFEKN